MNNISLYVNCAHRGHVGGSRHEHGITYLLPETDTGSGVERREDERVWYEILAETFVEEWIEVKFKCVRPPEIRPSLHKYDRVDDPWKIVG